MNKDDFLNLLHDQPGWNNMTQKSNAGIKVLFEGVYFEIFRDSANHFLRFLPLDTSSTDVVTEFNALWRCCNIELQSELEQSNMDRLFGDEIELDNIRKG